MTPNAAAALVLVVCALAVATGPAVAATVVAVEWVGRDTFIEASMVAAGIVGIAAGVRVLWRAVRATINTLVVTVAGDVEARTAGHYAQLRRDVAADVEAKLVPIQQQLTADGGATLRDAIDRIEQRVDGLHERVETHIATSEPDRAELHRRLDNLDPSRATDPDMDPGESTGDDR